MKGLLIKDFCVLSKQKKLAVMYLFLAFFLSFSMDTWFIVSYFPMIATILAFSTISYDTFDNGMAFLMTMPDGRKCYANEKYLLSFLVVAGSWIFAILVQFITLIIRGESFIVTEVLIQDLLYIPVFLLVCSFMIPIVLKYGSEKGRLIMFVIFGVVAVLIIAGKKLAEYLNDSVGIDLPSVISRLEQVPIPAIVAVGSGIVIVLLIISLIISNRIMQKKEY